MSGSSVPGRGTSRRTVVTAAGAVGAVGLTTALTACGSDSPDSSGDEASPNESSPEAGGTPAGGDLAKTSDIPEGGGKIFKDQKVVVTQPAAGDFKGFSAVCTHQGCIVSSVGDGTINCACHGSKYSIEDGSVKNGPATQALAPAPVTVQGDEVRLG
ncbi:Cytochrome b6-f complex iron-sulfur subunit [Streptomyces sp. RB5]|uniref:Cytochrome bc1 complex Rieske iron-sulfur subunit n=1 Tax=Streptomyces smaragdinus TaxID=2585196 RepID=A0A7K0CS03_9ACTN|nr:Rieske (2Fe-2S) protein [Streptomyces smaragdinus]MQY16123.1 Cytochrome b6-f complex iron-sulfur subunit [Streptomyces smaragdinus]